MSPLSESDKQALLALARHAVETAVRENRLPAEIPSQGIFAPRSSVFVTLRGRGRLRGCIGVIEPREPLGESIVHCAVSAAREDPRFPALQPGELADLHLEISLLTHPHRVISDEFELGRHGLLIQQGTRRGLLLPQVATEHGFSRERFLEETCRKAGLDAGAWKAPETEIYAFTCEIIAEAKEDLASH
jgi:AmmeMemoRadiSam system protein A